MADELRHLTHLLVTERATDEPVSRGGGGNPKIRPVERRAHGIALRDELELVFDDNDQERSQASVSIDELKAHGTFVTLEGAGALYPIDLDRLQRRTTHRKSPKLPKWLLMSVRPAAGDVPEQAVVWVSDTYRAAFLKLFEDYLANAQDKPNPPNNGLIANIARIRGAVLADLWQSAGEPPTDGLQWWELWLDRTETAVELLHSFADRLGIRVRDRVMVFSDRIVMWVEASWAALQSLPFTSVPVAEIRRPEFIDSIEDLTTEEQSEYVQDLADRVQHADESAPAVCHLDTGVLRGHVLLADSLSESDLHDAIGTSGLDVRGHGTSMAGLGLYGRLDDLLISNGPVRLSHRLESVRMIPGPYEPDTDPQDYGTLTVLAMGLPEATSQRRRVYCMPISTVADRPGEPTLWSASIDALAAGVDVVRNGDQLQLLSAPDPETARLMLLSAGNAELNAEADHDYLAAADLAVVDDPAQAWNALVVGAFTDLVTPPEHPQYSGWWVVADRGQLSPHSRTSVQFGSKWPIRPDICMEGGNVLIDGQQMLEDRHPSLTLRPLACRAMLHSTQPTPRARRLPRQRGLQLLPSANIRPTGRRPSGAYLCMLPSGLLRCVPRSMPRMARRLNKVTCCAVTAGEFLPRTACFAPPGNRSRWSVRTNSCHS